MEKFKNLIHYIIAHNPNISFYDLCDILWKIDSTSFKMYGKSITGQIYIKE